MTAITAARFERPRAKAENMAVDLWEWGTPQPDRQTVLEAVFALPYRVAHDRTVDTPTLPVKKNRVQYKRMLEHSWGITSADQTRQMMEMLIAGDMHTASSDAVLHTAEMLTGEFAPQEWRSQDFAARRRTMEIFLEHLAISNWMDPKQLWTDFDHWIAVRTHPSFANVNAPSAPATTRAWDIMRVEMTGATAALVGLITPEEYSSYASRAVAELQKHFRSWGDAAASFWWGRAIWSADTIRDNADDMQGELQLFDHILTEALIDPNSPWRRFPLHA